MIEMPVLTVKEEYQLAMLTSDDAEKLFDLTARNRDFFVTWIPFVAKMTSLQAMTEFLEMNLTRSREGHGLYCALWHGDQIIGYILAREIDQNAKWAEIGYMLDQEYTGQGITKAACHQLMQYLFAQQQMEKIVICCAEENEPSKAMARSLGFTLEGVLRNHFVVNDRLHNMCYYGLLREEYLG